jgi:microcystin-dependent protein
MAYEIDRTDKPNYGSVIVEDQTINVETSLGFVGKNYTGYSKVLAENFLHLLENFASATPPINPLIGQLWYDTDTDNNPPQPQLKVCTVDGGGSTSWVAAGNVTKRTIQPTTAVIGDLWVDTANQQLYLWSGSSWILVGPQFSEGAQSGPKVESVVDTFNNDHTILNFIVSGEIVAIVSKDAFTPKSVISGFTTINQGINMSTKDFDLDGTVLNKFWGTADRASKLIVSGYPEGLDANTFLRTDVAGTTNFGLNIRNDAGLTVGADLTTSLTVKNGATVLYNKNEGSSIFIRTNQSGTATDVLTIVDSKVGVNKNPIEALDVVGKVAATGGLKITATDDSTTLTNGSITTLGGASIAKTLRVGTGATIQGTAFTNTVKPTTDDDWDLGAEDRRYKRIFANTVGNLDGSTVFTGEFSGAFNGSVTGTATRLTSPTNFSLTGDITSNTISFNGQQVGGVAIFTTSISPDLITSKTPAFESLGTDEFLINRVGTGLRKLSRTSLLSTVATVPAGCIMPFAGSIVPNGYLLCDGAEVQISSYPELYAIIGNTYKGPADYLGLTTFRLPDLRGRFPLGADNMNNGIVVPLAPTGVTAGPTIGSSADRVTDITADQVGLGSGVEERQVLTDNLPDHTHDLTGEGGTQFYAPSDDTGGAASITDNDSVGRTAQMIPGFTKFLTTAGGVDSTITDVPLNVMNPYLTINYIIFTGRII